MNLPQKRSVPSFRPSLPQGCVARDRRMARALLGCYRSELQGIAASLCRSVLCEPHDRALADRFDALAKHRLERFRLVGELIFALGSHPSLRTQICVEPNDADLTPTGRSDMLTAAKREAARMAQRYSILTHNTADHVVLAILTQLTDMCEGEAEEICGGRPS